MARVARATEVAVAAATARAAAATAWAREEAAAAASEAAVAAATAASVAEAAMRGAGECSSDCVASGGARAALDWRVCKASAAARALGAAEAGRAHALLRVATAPAVGARVEKCRGWWRRWQVRRRWRPAKSLARVTYVSRALVLSGGGREHEAEQRAVEHRKGACDEASGKGTSFAQRRQSGSADSLGAWDGATQVRVGRGP